MNKNSKYRPLMDELKLKIATNEIGVHGLYRIMMETLDEVEVSLPKVRADAVRIWAKSLPNTKRMVTIERVKIAAHEHADKLEAGDE